MGTTVENIFDGVDIRADAERFDALLQRRGLRLERIVSHGQASPPGFWYDQPHDEWVMVLRGAARLEVEGAPERYLAPGDHMLLPAHCRHRVAWTADDEPTVWLAVHFGESV